MWQVRTSVTAGRTMFFQTSIRIAVMMITARACSVCMDNSGDYSSLTCTAADEKAASDTHEYVVTVTNAPLHLLESAV